jgi:hypothetical protein
MTDPAIAAATAAPAPRGDVDHPKNLYVREDYVLAQLARELGQAGGTRVPDQSARYLQSNQMMIVCDGVRCWLSSEKLPQTSHARKVNRRCGNSRPKREGDS